MNSEPFKILQPPGKPLDLDAIRAKLESAKGKQFWRSLNEVADSPEFQLYLEDEFPSRGDDWRDPASRRDILKLMGASFALAAFTGCSKQPQEKIVPFVTPPPERVPGRPMFYATAMPFRNSAVGLLVESHEGRPTKVEGNPQHPESQGRTTAFNQASTLELYDPDRSQAVIFKGRISSWGNLLGVMADLRQKPQGLHILSEPLNSPTLLAQRTALLAHYPDLRWHEYDPVTGESVSDGSRMAFGRMVNTVYKFDQADVILSLDSDFLMEGPGSIPYARGFISRRRGEADHSRMNRLYVAEPTPTITGDKADHRLPLRASSIEALARAIAGQIGVSAGAGGTLPPETTKWASVVAQDLQAHRGASLVLAGEHQPAAVHALAHAMNQSLGNVGRTVLYTEPLSPDSQNQIQPMRTLVDAMNRGEVRTLIVLGSANPVYNASVDLKFSDAFQKVPLRIHHGLYQDETAMLCQWHVPAAHYLESWSDVRAYDGTVTILQPLIAPLYEGKTAHEILAALTDTPDQSSYQIVKSFWQTQRPAANFNDFWDQSVHDGVVANSGYAPVTVAAQTNVAAAPANPGDGVEVVFRPDPSVWDGRFANNGWLQELPKPHTKLTWDNAAYLSPKTAQRLDLQNDDLVELSYKGRTVSAPVWIVPGHANESVVVHLGYGRRRAGRVGDGTGFNANAIRTSDSPYFGGGVQIRKLGGRYRLACTQDHHSMEGRDIVRFGNNQDYLKNPKIFLNEEKEEDQVKLSMYPEWQYTGYRWGMSIDQTACIGCNSCVVACQAENNIPVVGKDQVLKSREMHWIRIDRYHTGGLDNPESHFQPMLCQHCEKAPCEPVCPVAATVHSSEGISQMVYNRCVGTRYCSNNCPYKVRRFNFLLFQDWETPSLEPLRNPDVTVRSRGVMEKCSFCIQRIEEAKIEVQKENRTIRDGDVVTACQSSCPTDAIIFGNLNEEGSRVRKLLEHPLSYSLLAELSTSPRIKYMAQLRNPNPDMGNA
jgi:MoCo/4Fe-4S cofactor protein with predicted Tat translocation signal